MVPPAVQSPNPQETQQFLSSVLSQRGPSAVPYSEDTKWLIRQHLLTLITTFPSLEPKTATFTHNDGRTVNLLQADGTIPMTYQSVTYNIPVVIWLMESYPRHPPCVYVNPTRDMIIKRPHPHVNPSGLVSVPYLHNWIYPSSNLVDLVLSLSLIFGRDPPLYSQRRPNPNPNPNPNPISNPHHSHSHNHNHNPNQNLNPSSNFAASNPSGYTHPPRSYPPSPYSPSPPPSRPSHTEDPTEVFRRNAINKLVEMVHNDVASLRKTTEVETEGLFGVQGVLKQREESLNNGVKEMQEEMEGLEQQLQMVLMNTDVLEGWLKDNQGNKLGSLESVEDAFECVDVLSKQMLDCTAADLAIEDTLYALDKGVQVGAVPFDQYLRSVRVLSREQFFHRAIAAKVRAAQLQAQVANMATRIHHYGGS